MAVSRERIAAFQKEREGEFRKNPTTQEDTRVMMRSRQGFYKGAGEQAFSHI